MSPLGAWSFTKLPLLLILTDVVIRKKLIMSGYDAAAQLNFRESLLFDRNRIFVANNFPNGLMCQLRGVTQLTIHVVPFREGDGCVYG